MITNAAPKLIAKPSVELVTRDELPAMHTVMEGGQERVLGILKEFRRHERMRAFLPKDFKVSIAWVHLDAGQTLEAHVHPVDSMILVTKGAVRAFGERTADMIEGDMLLVPHGSEHGFTGAGPDGFWGLSIQFNSRGLYEDERDPWATFLEPVAATDEEAGSAVDRLLADNRRHLANFSKHRLFSIAKQGLLASDGARQRFYDCFQIWSNHFQRMLLVRSAMTDDPVYRRVSDRHLAEELGHNVLLDAGRGGRRPIWDPHLEAACSWFAWKAATLDDAERVVLIHLVVEASATVFYEQMRGVFAADPAVSDHAHAHADDADAAHVAIGVTALREGGTLDLERLTRVQRQGWDMLNQVMSRIADLVVG